MSRRWKQGARWPGPTPHTLMLTGWRCLKSEARIAFAQQAVSFLRSVAPTRVEFDIFAEDDQRVIGRVTQFMSQAEVERRWFKPEPQQRT